MATKTKPIYVVGDNLLLRHKGQKNTARITHIGKCYISCGDLFVIRKDTHRCINNMWEIAGLAPQKAKMRVRGKSKQIAV